MSSTADVIRVRRLQLRLSQDELGALVGVTGRQVGRYESGDQSPSLAVSVRLADALRVSLAELAGATPRGIALGGEWWAAWQTWKDDVERIDVHPLDIAQDGEFLQLDGARARSVEDGSYQWRGEMRLWDSEALMGWYRASDGGVRSKGTIYMALHPHGDQMAGSWTGLSHQGLIVRGWGAIARDRGQVEQLITDLCATRGNLKSWPKK
ncbi:helix-turn-helix transcriptional regulator [Nocardia cyriacigeorgica]|uniref:helix-turn-helix domain-containing protein n=1 Tax=Nocardia cyriacigeorgica TaxID=135487 RepID=UPI0018955C49|nr:helix-turn-helix transcriptional regulator [Nocardia cyriacigeorgica]MBF6085304.1 helix-turn-helix transcriptional regulator [Nocardia cyriacigeorgica]